MASDTPTRTAELTAHTPTVVKWRSHNLPGSVAARAEVARRSRNVRNCATWGTG